MVSNPEMYLGAVCAVTAAISTVFATIEWWNGLRPGSMPQRGVCPKVEKEIE